jgi:hypothetical protein
MLLVFNCLFDLGGDNFLGFLFLGLIDFSEGSSADLLDDLVPFLKNLLASRKATAH